ncbi:hypothetical protein [Nocardioides sp. WS12]|uniref:hypothetical protein n=1 Tax=Nocardioides sp. WS12 TaxID=2486272 RepID=UPI0015FCC8BF|nr:hypothetical protein [Nocardioides sp. WS12]
MPTASTADRLLDAQVAWLLTRITGAGLADVVAEDIDDLLDAGSRLSVTDLVDPAPVKELIRLVLQRVPASAAASTVVGIAADVAYDGPKTPFAVADVLNRDHVDALLSELLARPDLAAKFLDKVAESPLAASVAARFVTRIVGDVLATNRAVAEKIPGVGSLVSLGSSVARGVAGAADKQFEALLGDTAGKGATFAMRRLNKLLVETLSDPAAREAALQVFDLYADHPLTNLHEVGEREDIHRVAGLLQDIAIAGAASEPVLALADALVDGFFAVYGDHPMSTLVDDLGLTRDELVGQATALLPGLLAKAVESGEAERLIRARLAPFYASPEVAEILGS